MADPAGRPRFGGMHRSIRPWIALVVAGTVVLSAGALSACSGSTPSPASSTTAGVTATSSGPATSASSASSASSGGSSSGTSSGTSSSGSSGSPTATGGGTLRAIPAAFLGRWNTNLGDCAKPGTEGQLTIEARRVSFYESSGVVTVVTPGANNVITVEVTLTGEGETWTDTLQFQLTDGGKRLTSLSTDTVRFRCP